MFLVHTVHDTIRIGADSLANNTVTSIQNEIDAKYPNRVLMDVGLVIGRYDNNEQRRNYEVQKQQSRYRQQQQQQQQQRSGGSNTSNKRQRIQSSKTLSVGDGGLVRIGHGVCVTGDSGSHHDCTFQLIVFRPFVNEVCVGIVERSSADGIHISLGFFRDIFIPAYWMLNPSHYDPETGLWVWTPQYDDDDDVNKEGEETKAEGGGNATDGTTKNDTTAATNRYEMELGSQIRFKVKSINFTQITNTAKGMQATTISMGSSATSAAAEKGGGSSSSSRQRSGSIDDPTKSGQQQQQPLQRRRSSSVSGADEIHSLPSTMQVIASICEDGLGLTSWWSSAPDDEEEEEEVAEVEDEQEVYDETAAGDGEYYNEEYYE